MTTQINVAEMSLAALKALVAEQESAATKEAVEQGREFLTTLARSNVAKPGAGVNSTWVGFISKLSITIDGQKYEVSVNFKDVAQSDALKEERETQKLLEKHGDLIAKLAAASAAAANTEG